VFLSEWLTPSRRIGRAGDRNLYPAADPAGAGRALRAQESWRLSSTPLGGARLRLARAENDTKQINGAKALGYRPFDGPP
jgi:hypothetical protein